MSKDDLNKARRSKNRALLFTLLFIIALLYAITIMRMRDNFSAQQVSSKEDSSAGGISKP